MDFCNKESLIKSLQEYEEILKFGFYCFLKDVIAYDTMTSNLRYINVHYQLSWLWKN